MRTSQNGVNLIKQFEGFRNNPYLCSAGVPTIGWGSTYYLDGKKVTMKDDPISEAKAYTLLSNVIENIERDVNKLLTKVILNQNQYDAIISFVYNLGIGNFSKSTLLKKILIKPNDWTIKTEFMKWVNAGGVKVQGLVKRRQMESNLYFK